MLETEGIIGAIYIIGKSPTNPKDFATKNTMVHEGQLTTPKRSDLSANYQCFHKRRDGLTILSYDL